jgi:hypothetical protein
MFTNLCQFLQVLDGCFPDGVHTVREPGDTHFGKSFLKEGDAHLARQEGNVLDDSQPHLPATASTLMQASHRPFHGIRHINVMTIKNQAVVIELARHCLSSASSIIAGRRDCESESTPMTCIDKMSP